MAKVAARDLDCLVGVSARVCGYRESSGLEVGKFIWSGGDAEVVVSPSRLLARVDWKGVDVWGSRARGS